MTTEQMRELDAWIAENVMGWNRTNDIQQVDNPWVFYVHASEGVKIFERHNYIKPFKPTTDPAAAMEVLKKCGTKYSTLVEGGRKPDFKWRCVTWDDLIVGEYADTLELAICQFAKKLFTKE